MDYLKLKRSKPLLIIILLLSGGLLLSGCSESDDPKFVHYGKKISPMWYCAKYAAWSGEEEVAQKLFMNGLEAGRLFIDQIEKKQVDSKYVRSSIPLDLSMLLYEGTPSKDFVLGRYYEAVSNKAYDDLVKKDAIGGLLDSEDWIRDEEVKKMRAENFYREQNCEMFANDIIP